MKNPYSERIIERIEKQTDKGISKYGANLKENPLHLSISQVVEYAAEEAADLTVYLEKVKEMVANIDYVIDAISSHDKNMLLKKAGYLKGTDGEGWAVGEMIERVLLVLELGEAGTCK